MKLPELRTQLNTGSGTEGADCGVLTIINIVLWASDGRIGPSLDVPENDDNSVASWVKDIRRWTRNRTGPMMTRDDCFRAYTHPELVYKFHKAHIKPPKATYHYGLGWGSVIRELNADKAIHMCVNYGVLRMGNAPTGSDSFSGGHSVALIGTNRPGRYLHTNDGDPLFDGRRKNVPNGWQNTRLYNFRKAAGAFAGIGLGHAVCIVVEMG